MIYIKEYFLNNNNRAVRIKVDGVLDKESIPSLRSVFMQYLGKGKMVSVDLTQTINISREGKTFLKEFEDQVIMIQD
jgi:hypothetical protein